MYTLLRQRRLRWLGHVGRMDDGRIPKDLLYGELAKGKRLVGRPKLRSKDVCKRDMKSTGLNVETWETLGNDEKDLESRDAQNTPSWGTAHHSSRRGGKSEEEGQLRTFKNPTRGTVRLPELQSYL